ncbi:MAG: M48 family metallopeptidase [Deltaproteobacteria bacterium]|nr:M48 family metallopeptidase [Deltaproteobacteria bacterium]MDZ4345976.1 M48 family metallopeptidase [Candidatus Binatia bacterium]
MEQLIVGSFLSLFTLEFLVEFTLNELNLRHVRGRIPAQNIPDIFRAKIQSADYDKSVQYTLAKGRFQRWADLYGRAVLLVILFSGLLPWLDTLSTTLLSRFFPVAHAQGIIFCLAVGAVFFIIGLPADLYATFRLEARFGFNKTTVKLYVADKFKGLMLGVVFGVPLLYVVLWLMEATGRYWWIGAFVFICGFELLMIVIYPTFIAPLFNKFEPLKDGNLRDRILKLAEQVGFHAIGIYSMDGSRRSAHSNAYFTGIGKAKRIVLFDTLIEQMTIEQGVAVLAHEMGHYKMKHIRRMLVVQTVFLFVGLFILSLLVEYRPLFSAFGLQPTSHAVLVLFSLLSGPFTFYLAPLMNLLSRKHEYEADRFAAVTLRDGRPMEEALVNLTVKNLSNLTPHPWYSFYHYSHPTPVERIEAIRRISV